MQNLMSGLQATTTSTTSPMQRRSQKLDNDGNIKALEEANAAVSQLPPDQQGQYAATIQAALKKAKGG